MAALYKHIKSGYRVQFWLHYRDGTRQQKTKYCKVKTRAILMQKELDRLETLSANNKLSHEDIVNALHRGYISEPEVRKLTDTQVVTATVTWNILEADYMTHIRTVGSELSRLSYPYICRAVIRKLSHIPPATIKEADIRDMIDTMRAQNKAKATVNKYLQTLRIMLDTLVKKGILADNPARKIKDFSGTEERLPRVIYPEELHKFFQGLEDNKHLLFGYFSEMLATYLYTGMRRHELLTLKTSQINFTHKYIRVEKTKNNKERVIELHPQLISVLKAVLDKNYDRKGLYFFGGQDRPLCRADAITRAFNRFTKQIGLPAGITLHSLRHTFITYLLKAGVDLKSVQSIAGHKKLSTTYRYIHLIPSHSSVSKIDFEI